MAFPAPRRLASSLLSAVALLVSTAALGRMIGCSVYDDSLRDPIAGDAAPPIPTGAGVGWWSGTGDNGCFSAGHPKPSDRPAPTSPADIGPVYVAITKLRLGSQDPSGTLDENAWKKIGLDLDDSCTGSGTCDPLREKSACKAPSKIISFDGDDCRDNNFGRFEYSVATIPEVGETYRLNDDMFNCGLCTGLYNFIIRVTGYNGQANDDHVRVDLYPSPGLEAPLAFDCVKDPSNNKLCWLPNQPFLIDQASMASPKEGPDLADAKIADPDAYVRDGYIVISLPDDSVLWFPSEPADQINTFPIILQKGIVTGKVQKSSEGVWTVSDGIIAGRVKKDDVIGGFRSVGFCDKDPRYGLMTSYVLSNLDVSASGKVDPESPCDALSIAVAFEARQATPGKLAAVAPLKECVGVLGGAGSGGAAGSAGSAGKAGAAGSTGGAAGSTGGAGGSAGSAAGSAGAGG